MEDTTILCSQIIMNPNDRSKIKAPDKGELINKSDYRATIITKNRECEIAMEDDPRLMQYLMRIPLKSRFFVFSFY